MNQDTVVSLATQAMTLALEVAGPILLVGPRRRAHRQPLPGRHPDPGADPDVHPEDRRPWRS